MQTRKTILRDPPEKSHLMMHSLSTNPLRILCPVAQFTLSHWIYPCSFLNRCSAWVVTDIYHHKDRHHQNLHFLSIISPRIHESMRIRAVVTELLPWNIIMYYNRLAGAFCVGIPVHSISIWWRRNSVALGPPPWRHIIHMMLAWLCG